MNVFWLVPFGLVLLRLALFRHIWPVWPQLALLDTNLSPDGFWLAMAPFGSSWPKMTMNGFFHLVWSCWPHLTIVWPRLGYKSQCPKEKMYPRRKYPVAWFGSVRPSMALCGPVWHCLTLIGSIESYLATFGQVWPHLAAFGCVWSGRSLFCNIWYSLVLLAWYWPSLAPCVKRHTSYTICFMAENWIFEKTHEKFIFM